MENPNFHLEGVVRVKEQLEDFEGPLSLILTLLSKNKIEIRDIRISDILEQYLDYLAQMESMDLEIASEFIQMASHLLYIKTKTLLSGDDEEVSELEVLMASLEQLKCRDLFSTVQQVIPSLRDASKLGMLYFAKLPEAVPKSALEYNYSHEPVELLKALRSIYSRGVKTPESDEIDRYIPKRIAYSVRDKSRQILSLLKKGDMGLRQLYMSCGSRSELVAAFVSVLELCSMGTVSVKRFEGQDDYTLSFIGGELEEIIEQISE